MTIRALLILLLSLTFSCTYRDTDTRPVSAAEAAITHTPDSLIIRMMELQQQERIKAEAANEKLSMWLIVTLSVVLILSVCVIYLKSSNKSQMRRLHEAINSLNTLRQALDDPGPANIGFSDGRHKTGPETDTSPVQGHRSVHNLRVQMRDELMSSCNRNGGLPPVPAGILESDAYEKVLRNIKQSKTITENDSLWEELEKVVLQSSPDFKYSLYLLTGGKLKASDFHLALLIKCGISPTHISILVGRAKTTISYRREALGQKIFDQKLRTGAIDGIIRLL